MSDQEHATRSEIKLYFTAVQTAFAARDARALAELFDPDIKEPMTQRQILQWGEKFFGENSEIRFQVRKLEFDEIGAGRAVVTLTYQVATEGGRGDFGGVETDTLEKRGGRWLVVSWKKG